MARSGKKVVKFSAVLPLGGHGKAIMLGITRCLNRLPYQWSIRPVDPDNRFLCDDLEEWEPDALFYQSGVLEAEQYAEKMGVPSARLLGEAGNDSGGRLEILLDDIAVGRMAGAYFLSRGFQHFAYVGNKIDSFSTNRLAGYRKSFSHGTKVHDFLHSTPESDPAGARKISYHKPLGEWLATLPKPVAVFAANDWDALHVSQACTLSHIRIPTDVAVLGAGNDELLCHISRSKLSSIDLPFAKIGAEAARRLLRKLEGRSAKAVRQVFKPTILVSRESTRHFLLGDSYVRKAMDFIESEVHRPLKVAELLEHLGISRPNLEARFKAQLGRTPLVEIQRQRVERAKALLADTNLTNAEVAKRSGFSSNIRFVTVFKQQTGETPGGFRRQFRVAAEEADEG